MQNAVSLIAAVCALACALTILTSGALTRSGRIGLHNRIGLIRRGCDAHGWSRLATLTIDRDDGQSLITVDVRPSKSGHGRLQLRATDQAQQTARFSEKAPSGDMVGLTLSDLGLIPPKRKGLSVAVVKLSERGEKTFQINLRSGALAGL